MCDAQWFFSPEWIQSSKEASTLTLLRWSHSSCHQVLTGVLPTGPVKSCQQQLWLSVYVAGRLSVTVWATPDWATDRFTLCCSSKKIRMVIYCSLPLSWNRPQNTTDVPKVTNCQNTNSWAQVVDTWKSEESKEGVGVCGNKEKRNLSAFYLLGRLSLFYHPKKVFYLGLGIFKSIFLSKRNNIFSNAPTSSDIAATGKTLLCK